MKRHRRRRPEASRLPVRPGTSQPRRRGDRLRIRRTFRRRRRPIAIRRRCRSFATFTGDLHRLADWLTACRVTHVAMEATGVYWIPIFEILEARGFTVVLVNARHVKHVPGRKSDVSDCEWLRDLHIVGLLRGSFRPADAIVALRAYLRHRATLIESAGAIVQRMQKALVQMNVQLPLVVSDITGVDRAAHPARHRGRPDAIRSTSPSIATIAATPPRRRSSPRSPATTARSTSSCLRQNLEALRPLSAPTRRVRRGHRGPSAQRYRSIAAPRRRRCRPARPRQKPHDNEPRFDIRTPLHQLTGVDLSQIDGIGPYTALRLLSEIGTDMTRWPTDKHFTSWLTLAPKNKISGGRLLSSRTQPSANRAAAILRVAAMNLGRTQTALGAFYRRLAFRVGKAKAVTATARKLAILVYRTLKDGLVYAIPAPTPMTPSTAPRSSATASTRGQPRIRSSIAQLARSSRGQFLRRQEPAAAHARDDFIRTSSHTLKCRAVGQTSTMLPLLEGERCQSWDREEADVERWRSAPGVITSTSATADSRPAILCPPRVPARPSASSSPPRAAIPRG